jgi:NAD(P)-dependent dehydrogenase (short-subunit alcohol dehydrogenase family)
VTTSIVARPVPATTPTDLSGHTAVITGGTKGIGQATVARFVAGGARVVTSGRSDPDSLPDGVEFVSADVSTLEGVRHLADQAAKLLGEIDIIVNNAGASTPHMGGVLDIADDEWLKDLNINFMAAVRLNAALLPNMYARGGGSIVNISSAVRMRPNAAMLHYASAKAAIRTYTMGLAAEAGPRGVRVNSVTPGDVESPGADAVRQAIIDSGRGNALEAGGAPHPLNRQGQPTDIAEAVAFLASDRTPWITATDLVVDGGQFQTN